MADMTPRRAVILTALLSGPKTWTSLRTIYFGAERATSDSSTAFVKQLHRMQDKGLIENMMGAYEITDKGRSLMHEAPVKVECKHLILNEFGRCIKGC